MTKGDLQHYYRYIHKVTNNQRQCKKIIFILLCLCCVTYLFVDYNFRTKIIQIRDRFELMARVDADYNITQSYFVDTPGCHIPYFDVSNYRILQYMGSPPNLTCGKPLTRASQFGSRLWWPMTDEELMHHYKINDTNKINCHYAALKHNHSTAKATYADQIPFKLLYNQSIEISGDIEFIRVRCTYYKSKHYFYEDYHFFPRNKRKSKVISYENSNRKKNIVRKIKSQNASSNGLNGNNNDDNIDRLSVMVLGIDSVSHLNFLRHMKRSAAFIRKRLHFVEFWGFNKVGDNIYSNIIPLLTGLAADELRLSCIRSKDIQQYVDDCPFIWKRFKECGYLTAFVEDIARASLFTTDTFFKHQPTDYYIPPIPIKIRNNIEQYYKGNEQFCMGGHRTVDLVFEMINKLMPLIHADHFFSFFWLASMTQDLIYMPKLLDNDFVNLLEQFQVSGIVNKTIILLMSDHGLSGGSFGRTYQGMMEERQPLFIAIYPNWFKQKYADAIKNLEINSKRLTTFYDVHATILDILNLNHLNPSMLQSRSKELRDNDVIPRGVSLFLPVPETRTCEHAGIPAQWCTCYHHIEMPTNDGRVQEAARYLVKLINNQLKPYPQCRVLYLNSIQKAVLGAPHRAIIKDITHEYGIDIKLRIQTKPGLAVFESTVRISGYTKTLTNTISRLNLYGSQSYCINNNSLKMYCYCHR